jgi:prepilin-type N-terminal cleavage/methylation domain-containing protein
MDSLLSVSKENNVDFGCACGHCKASISPLRGGFTLIEVMVVIVIIGILASLAYSSLIDLIFANRAKETAQTMRTFAERSLAEAKRMNLEVTLSLENSNIVATYEKIGDDVKEPSRQPFSDGFIKNTSEIRPGLPGKPVPEFDGGSVKSLNAIGFFGVVGEGSFVACGGKGYCGGVIKRVNKNSFEAWIKKGTKADWSEIKI